MENDIAKRIKMLRETLGLTQKEFAAKLGRTIRAVQRYESGQRSPDETTLRLIEQTFNVNPEWLRHGKGEMFSQKEEKQEDVLLELFKAMEQLEGKVPRIVKKAIYRMYETQDIKGLIEIFTDYLYDLAEGIKRKNIPTNKEKFKGNYSNQSVLNIQSFLEDKDET